MKITYSIWHGARIVALDAIATSADEIKKNLKELNSISDGVLKYAAHISKVEVNA